MLKQWCSTCSPTVRLVGIYCQLNLLQEPHPGNRRVKQMNETHCHGEHAGEEPLQLPPITIHNPSNSSAERNKHKIFLAKAIQPCPPVSSSLSCGRGDEEMDLPFHCLLRSSQRRLRELGRNSTHPAPLYRNASTLVPSPLGFSSPSHRLERLATKLERSFKHVINSGNTQEKTAGLSEFCSNSF